MSLLAKSLTRSALNHKIYHKPQKQNRKTFACKRTDTKPRNTKVFKFDHEGVCVAIELIKPHSKR